MSGFDYTRCLNNTTLDAEFSTITDKFKKKDGMDINTFTKLVDESKAKALKLFGDCSSDNEYINSLFNKLHSNGNKKVEYDELASYLDRNYDINIDVYNGKKVEEVVKQIENVDNGELVLEPYDERLKARAESEAAWKKLMGMLETEWDKFEQDPEGYIKETWNNMKSGGRKFASNTIENFFGIHIKKEDL